jgi:hypothetical protein
MLNLRGNTVAEVDGYITEARDLLVPSIIGFEEDAKSVGLIMATFPGTAPVPSDSGQQASNVAQRPAQPGNGGAPTCIHGARVHRAGADWQGWFCPAERSDPTKCKPQYIR